jgi:thioredoxin-dependent peroxiredoxin
VLGASFDTPEENRAFAAAQGFEYRLLSDVDRAVGEAYDVKRAPGERYAEYPERVSYLIDPDGIIRRVYEVADVAAHASAVLHDLELLTA